MFIHQVLTFCDKAVRVKERVRYSWQANAKTILFRFAQWCVDGWVGPVVDNLLSCKYKPACIRAAC